MKHDSGADPRVAELVARALAEDVGGGDASSIAAMEADARAGAYIEAREDLVIAGLPVAEAVFRGVDPAIGIQSTHGDGDRVMAGEVVQRVEGPARSLLTAERTALNFLQRISGIATLTAAYVDRVAGTGVAILDTRKTTPTLRFLDKYAVLCGGGENHRMGLYDRIMFKDNHLVQWRKRHRGDLGDLVDAGRDAFPELAIEVEVESVDDFRRVIAKRPEWILLDNMSLDAMRECVALREPPTKLEASGGVNLDTVAGIAGTGVDAISIGGLTHSSRWVDLAMEVE